jgi:FSR family fosmidomycin resistance protein-like MFS transporter
VGAVAEAVSLRVALACLVPFPVLAWLLARTLTEPAQADATGTVAPPAGRPG